jgi:hypothetical protein
VCLEGCVYLLLIVGGVGVDNSVVFEVVDIVVAVGNIVVVVVVDVMEVGVAVCIPFDSVSVEDNLLYVDELMVVVVDELVVVGLLWRV